MLNHFTISIDNFVYGRVHTLITNSFNHSNGHIIYNMIILFYFGRTIGRWYGSDYLLKLYLAGAITGSLLYLLNEAFFAPLSKKKIDPANNYALGNSYNISGSVGLGGLAIAAVAWARKRRGRL
ncbi:hypothetical protein Ddye_001978 [Dipteronia dyeriana]|uniref:Peptidase S54 rhomboid domain-containing protein n=1 Tax=Dipteronia dyeriana TaxID=168575 RepID=A0AAD9XPK6_9ROSI|nr:hypothetical protein Ddye_001978 [Dipteronia dyeriana]